MLFGRLGKLGKKDPIITMSRRLYTFMSSLEGFQLLLLALALTLVLALASADEALILTASAFTLLNSAFVMTKLCLGE